MRQNIINVLVSGAVVLLAIAMLCLPRTTIINNPAPPDTCKCPPPPTQAELDAQEKQEQCVRFKRYFLNTFGSLPYDPCPEPPKGPPLDGMGRPIP